MGKSPYLLEVYAEMFRDEVTQCWDCFSPVGGGMESSQVTSVDMVDGQGRVIVLVSKFVNVFGNSQHQKF